MLGRSAKLYGGAGWRLGGFGGGWSGGSSKEGDKIEAAGKDAVYPNLGIGGLTIQIGLDGQF
jgi:hypothetical protein